MNYDLHHLYEAAVQNVEADIEFLERLFREEVGREPITLREDFCGTASLAAHWCSGSPERRAYGVDLDEPTVAWGLEHRVRQLDVEDRTEVLLGDVRQVHEQKVDLQTAFNFSFCVFQTREEIVDYFRCAQESLADDGVFALDLLGGTETCEELVEKTKVPARTDIDGTELPPFTYVWDQAAFNPIDHSMTCHIHFKLGKGQKLKRAFTYDWRLWTITELRELMSEAGFARSKVYVEGWDDDTDEPDGDFRETDGFDNSGSWIAYVVGFKSAKGAAS
ncbi:MAG: class I SAM-dependent methyltransferase [Acidobacteriota bacterium]